MTEQQFTDLLKMLKIPINNRSYGDLFELLDAKLSEYLDRQDARSQELIDDIQDALDYAELKKNEVGSGIALKVDEAEGPDKDDLDLDELAKATKQVRAEKTSAPMTGTTGATFSQQESTRSGSLWFTSLDGTDSVNRSFILAVDDLKYGDYSHADDIFESILTLEPKNASAYLGKVMAKHGIKELRGIGSSYDKDIFQDVLMQRAYDHAIPAQKKYLDDARHEVECGKKYKDADKAFKTANSQADVENVKRLFMEIKDYRDASQRIAQCEKKILEMDYAEASSILRTASSVEACQRAAAIFRRISGYRDADEQAKRCAEKEVKVTEANAQRREDEKLSLEYDHLYTIVHKKIAEFQSGKKNFIDDVLSGRRKTEYDMSAMEDDFINWKRFVADFPRVKELRPVEKNCSDAESAMKEIRDMNKDVKKVIASKKRDKLIFLFLLILVLLSGTTLDTAYGIGALLPISTTDDSIRADSAVSPYLVSASKIDHISLSDSESIRWIFTPLSRVESIYLSNGDYSKLNIPGSVKVLSLTNVTDMEVPEGVDTLLLTNTALDGTPGNVKTLSLTRSMVSEIPDSVTEFTYSGVKDSSSPYDNVDMTALDVKEVTEYELPEGLKKLSVGGYVGTDLLIPEGVEEVSLRNCPNADAIRLPSAIKKLTFANYTCPYIVVPEGVESFTLDFASGLQELSLPSTLKELRLSDARGLAHVSIPEGVEVLEIDNCDYLEELIIPESVTSGFVKFCEDLMRDTYF